MHLVMIVVVIMIVTVIMGKTVVSRIDDGVPSVVFAASAGIAHGECFGMRKISEYFEVCKD
jgi:hypothetical protein